MNGPTYAIIGGIHGNERPGVKTVETLRDLFSAGRILHRGTLYLILGNLKAIEENQRFTTGGQDLNRLFSEEYLSLPPDQTSYEDGRVRELAPILRLVDISIDVHATNKPSCPFIYSALTPRHATVYNHFFIKRVVSDPKHLVAGKPVSTDEFVDLNGGIGICLELGWCKNNDQILREKILNNLFQILENCPAPLRQPKRLYRVSHPLLMTDEHFLYAPGVGERSFESCRKGQVIGFEHGRAILSPMNGVILYPKIREHWQLGKPVGYLAEAI